MRNAVLLLLLLLGGVAIAAWWWWRDDAPSPGPATPAAATPVNPEPAPASAAGAPVAAKATPERRLADVSATAAAGSNPPLPADAKWLVVRAVDSATKAPVPRAEVRWALGSTWQQIQQLPEGAALHVSVSQAAPSGSQVRFRTEYRSGPLDSLIGSPSARGESTTVASACRSATAATASARVRRKAGEPSSQPVRGVVSAEIVGGRDLAPIEVTVPVEELQKALAPK
jgi:hypothetical protein